MFPEKSMVPRVDKRRFKKSRKDKGLQKQLQCCHLTISSFLFN